MHVVVKDSQVFFTGYSLVIGMCQTSAKTIDLLSSDICHCANSPLFTKPASNETVHLSFVYMFLRHHTVQATFWSPHKPMVH